MTGLTDISSIDDVAAAVAGTTAPRRFVELLANHGDAPALHAMVGDGAWHDVSYREYGDMVARAAAGLRAAGVEPGHRMLLMMRNIPDFHWFDSAAQFLRATPVSIYNSSSAEEIQYLAGHAEAEIAILEDSGFLDKMLEVRDQLPMLDRIYVLNPPDGDLPEGVFPASDLLDAGSLDLDELAEATQPDDLATLIYTSGTTGPPKGVMISQYNVVFAIEILRRSLIDQIGDFTGFRTVSYLPMAHIAERAMSHYSPMVLGYDVYSCPDPSQLTMYLKEVHPQILFGVPRVWEKVYSGVQAALGADPEKKEKFDEAVAAATAINRASFGREQTTEEAETMAFLDAVAFSTVRGLVGLDELVIGVTGAAPIPDVVLEWFHAIGVNLTEIYGMSETTGPMTWSPERNKVGSVGRACHGMEVKIADDGEVLCRGGNIFGGYLKQPEQTAETIIDGWLHSGDIGEIDDEGYIKIVDRKKELIITAGGKNISPANLEAELKTIPLIGQAAAIGDQRKFVSAILVLDPEVAPGWARANGKEGMSLNDLAKDPEVIAEVQAGVDRANERFARVEQIKRFTLIGEEWMPDSDMLTPTSKLKRRGVNARYADEIEAMYADGHGDAG
ncbi:MAG: AMP-dependent synthetase/ligase [Ilumatobacter sp.]|uniref:AMP-dependent synthetase/ligase n=1 Tax=Ilumatobacter sp. TaxID=1967498 RepID=UPI00391A9AF0